MVSTAAHTNALLRKSLTFQKRQTGTNCCQVITAVVVVLFMISIQAVVDSLVEEGAVLTSQQLLYPPTYPPALVKSWEEGEQPQCGSVPSGAQPVLANASSGGVYPPQPASVTPANLWAIVPPELHAMMGSLSAPGAAVGSGPGVFGSFDTSPALTFWGEAFPQFNAFSICRFAPQYSYPVSIEMLNDSYGIQAELYNAYAVVGAGRLGGYFVEGADVVPGTKLALDYAVHYNKTVTDGMDIPMFSSRLAAAALRLFSGGQVTMEGLGIRNFPRTEDGVQVDIITLFAPFMYIYVFQLTMPAMLTSMVFEKENRLLEIMRMMGLRMPAYWVVTYLFNFLLYFISVMFFWIIAAMAGFRYFLANDPGIVFLVFFMWGHTMVAFVFFLRSLFSKTSTATVVGYLIIFTSGLLSSQIYRVYLDEPETPKAIVRLFYLFPPMVLYRAILALSQGVLDGGPGLRWADINHPRVELGEVFFVLFLEWVILLVLAFYLDAVLKGPTGIPRHPLFCLRKETYTSLFGGADDEANIDQYNATPIAASVDGEPADVAAMRSDIRNHDGVYALRVADLDMTYPARGGAPPKHAVISSTLAIERGEVFGLLGATGSGKTSLISLATGLLTPDSGTAHINGHDIRKDTRIARMSLGVCPQHDLLWDDLTGPEHVRFYGRVKGLSGDELTAAVDDVLDQVHLGNKATRRKKSSEYSGGMKRRLSLACALIGDPDVVVLDEPTTGLDPASKRGVWRALERCRETSAVLLTTHSMLEAESLCDRLVVVVDGQMKAHGTVASLKSRFSEGYKLAMSFDEAREAEAHSFVLATGGPETKVLNTLANVRNYEISRKVKLPKVYQKLTKSAAKHGVLSWELTHSSMEEVFLNIVSQYWSAGIAARKRENERAGGIGLETFSSPSSSNSSSSSSRTDASPTSARGTSTANRNSTSTSSTSGEQEEESSVAASSPSGSTGSSPSPSSPSPSPSGGSSAESSYSEYVDES